MSNLLPDELSKQLNTFLGSQTFLSRTFSRVNFIYVSHKACLVPKAYFVAENIKQIFEFNHVLAIDEILDSQYVSALDSYLISSTPASVASVMVNKYKDVNFYHQSYALLLSWMRYVKTAKDDAPQVLAHVHSNVLDVVVATPYKLLFHNSFEFFKPEDALYYIGYVYQTLELKAAKNPLQLAGSVELNDGLYAALEAVFGEMYFFGQLYKDLNMKVAKHQFVNLVNL
jgi:hypothetical protein